MVRESVPRRGILRVDLRDSLPLRFRRIFLADVVEKTAVGDPRVGVIGMGGEEVFVAFDDRLEPALDAPIQRGLLNVHLRNSTLVAFLDPSIDLRLGRIVVGHQLLIGLFDGVVHVRDGDAQAGLLLNEITHRAGRIRRHERAEQTDEKIVHEAKLARAVRKRKRRIMAVFVEALGWT